jgi:hypothetical protein
MTLSILLPFLVCLVGLIVWAVASQGKPQPNPYLTTGGEVAYACGLLVTLFECATHVVTTLSPAVSASLAFIVCIAGFLIWVLAGNTVLKRAGLIAFAEGLLVVLFEVATHVVHF